MGKTSKKQTIIYIVAVGGVLIALLLLGSGHWINEMSYQKQPSFLNHWNWTQIIVSLAIGFVIGLFVAKKKW